MSYDIIDLQRYVLQSKNNKTNLPRFPMPQQMPLTFDDNLESLNLQQSRLLELPKSISTLHRLRIVNLNDNFIKLLDCQLFQHLRLLESLTIRNNLLQEFNILPQWSTTLKQLDISQNHIKVLKPQIGTCMALEQLFIAHNCFIEIPIEVTNLKSTLSVFHLDWFKYGEPPLQTIFTQERVYMLFSMIEQVCHMSKVTLLSAKTLLNHPIYKSFALKFQSQDSNIRYRLHQCILDEDIGMLRSFIADSKKCAINELNDEGYSPLALSILEEKYMAARHLLYAGANPNMGGGWFNGCMNIAVSKLQYYLVIDLIKRGAHINQVDQFGNSCIHYLISVFHYNDTEAKKILELLLQHGAHPDSLNNQGLSPIHLAIQKGQMSILRYLYESSKAKSDSLILLSFNQKTHPDKNTCLHLAVISRNINSVKFLATFYPEQMFQRNTIDCTPLEYLKNDLTIFKYLKLRQKQFILRRLRQTFECQSSSIIDQELSDYSYGEECSIKKVQSVYDDGSTIAVKVDMASPLGSQVCNQVGSQLTPSKMQVRGQKRLNEITRQIPLSPNNLSRLELKNQMMGVQNHRDQSAFAFKILKSIAYDFERAYHNVSYLNNLLNNEQSLAEQIGEMNIIKRLIFELNNVKNLTDQNDIYKQQWRYLLSSLNLGAVEMTSERSLGKGANVNIVGLFSSLVRKIENANISLSKSDVTLSNFICCYFLSAHCGFGLSKLVVSLNQMISPDLSLINQFEQLQIKNQLHSLPSKYNIFNQKVLNNLFTI